MTITNKKEIVKLRYGIRENKVVHIRDLSDMYRGLKCNCKCPNCGGKLLAKLGDRNKWHFAHINSECDINIANQTALHLLAKEIIDEDREFNFPKLSICLSETKYANYRTKSFESHASIPENLIYRESRKVNLDKVTLEKRILNIVPDIIVETKGKVCLIEIAVTHFIDNDKVDKIENIGLPVIEVDLSSWRNSDIDKEKLRQILSDNNNAKWIFNPLKNEAISWANLQYEIMYKKLELEFEDRINKFKEEQDKIQNKKLILQKKVNNLFTKDKYKIELLKYINDKKANDFISQKWFFRKTKTIPNFVNIPIEGEMVFKCDRRIWQSEIFDVFVFNRKKEATITCKKVEYYVIKYQKAFTIDWSLMGKVDIRGNMINMVNHVIERYLYYLVYLGFIHRHGRSYRVLKSASIISPNDANSKLLEDILSQVDLYSYKINEDIDKVINIHNKSDRLNIYSHRSEKYKVRKNYEASSSNAEAYEANLNKLAETTYNRGYNYVVEKHIFNNSEIKKDCFGFRWFKCESCGEILRVENMIVLGQKIFYCRNCEFKY